MVKHIGDARVISLDDARIEARRFSMKSHSGRTPAQHAPIGHVRGLGQGGTSKATRASETKVGKQAAALVEKYLIPRFGKLSAAAITSAEVRAMKSAMVKTPSLANQVLKTTKAIFSWAMREEIITVNPAKNVELNKTKSRERVLSTTSFNCSGRR